MNDTSRDQFRRVAQKQRMVIFALLAYILVYVLAIAVAQHSPLAGVIVLVIALGVAIFALVSIVALALEIASLPVAIVCAILMFVPCVSLIVLLVINQKATSYLQQHGIKVGFLGVDPKSI